MASRQQQPIIASLIILGIPFLLVALRFASDLHTPLLFLLKAALWPMMLCALFIGLACALWKRTRLTSWCAVVAGLLLLPFLMPNINLANNTTADHAQGTEINVATFSAMTRSHNSHDIQNFIKQHNPDILCLQEIASNDLSKLLTHLDGHYAYHQSSKGNLSVFSHYPLIAQQSDAYQTLTISPPNHANITLFNVHMSRPYRQTQGLAWDWLALLEDIDQEDNTILCGDFNFTPNNTLYDMITGHYGYTDALNQGYGFTYPNANRRSAVLGPLIRIDYLFSSKLRPSNTQTIDVSRLSDHRAVLTTYHSFTVTP